MSWTIIRSPPTDGSSSQPSSPGSERSLTPGQLRNLAYYVTWVFSNPDRSTGLDFNLPTAEPSGVGSSTDPIRRDSRCEATPPSSSASAISSASRTGSSGGAYLDAGRATAIQQWVAKTSPESVKEDEDTDEEDDDEEDDSSGSESD